MVKKIKKLETLKKSKFNPLTLAVFIAVMAGAGYIILSGKAAPSPPTIYLTPASQTYAGGATVTVQVRENSATTAVNAVQANFTYPANLLRVTGVSYTNSAYGIQAETLPYLSGTISQTGTIITGTGTTFTSYMNGKTITYSDGTTATVTYVSATSLTSSVSKTVAAGSSYVIGAGSVAIGVGTNGGTSVTGDQLIATITFTTTSASGTANLAFITGTALVNAAAPNNDLLGGNLALTGGATYVVDNTPPTVNVTAPTNSSTVPRDSTVSITATATDVASSVSKVDFYIDGGLAGSDTSSPYSFSWNTTGIALGAHTIQAKSTDSAGNLGSSSVVNVTVADQTGPAVSLTAPASSAVVSGSAVTLSANATDNIGVVGVQFKLDGQNLGTEDTTSPYSISWNTTTATSGTHTITAVARDAAGNTTSSSSVTVTVDNAAPTVSITTPTSGSTVSGSVAVSATATDNTGGSGIAKTEFYVDGTLASTDTTSPYSFSWDTSTVALGAHSLTSKAYDKASPANVATSAAVTVTVADGIPPSAPTNLHATSITSSTVSLAWTASTDNIGVAGYQVKRNGNTITTVTSPSYTDTGLTSATTYSYTVVAVDAAGNASAAAGPLSLTSLSQKPGDLNGDGQVDLFDISILLSNWGATNQPQYDLNGNGMIDIFDLSILLTNYGT
jgi:chitodextrinase